MEDTAADDEQWDLLEAGSHAQAPEVRRGDGTVVQDTTADEENWALLEAGNIVQPPHLQATAQAASHEAYLHLAGLYHHLYPLQRRNAVFKVGWLLPDSDHKPCSVVMGGVLLHRLTAELWQIEFVE